MNRLETFDYLIDIIDKWQEEKPGRYEGSCKSLRKDTWIREVIVTPGFHISVSMLKTFLMAEVIDIYAKWRTNAKISWRNMRAALTGESKKKYSFSFEELDRCFSSEKNKEAAKKIYMLEGREVLLSDLENWEDIPLYLLNRLREIFQKKLGEYWRLCRKSQKEEDQDYEKEFPKVSGEDSEEEEHDKDKKITAPKREKYRECIMAAALHEIFVREFLEKCNKILKENQKMEREQEEENVKASKEQMENMLQEIEKQRKQLGKHIMYLVTCLEHCISVEAEIQLLMLLEVKRLSLLGYKIEYPDYLNFIKGQNLNDRGNYNRNKKECYKQLDNMVKDTFIFYMKKFQQKKIQDVSDEKIFMAIEKYLKIVEQRNLDDRKRRELWNVQCLMVIPLMCKAYSKID